MDKKTQVIPKLAQVIEIQLDKCIKNKKVPNKKLLDTLDIFKRLTSF